MASEKPCSGSGCIQHVYSIQGTDNKNLIEQLLEKPELIQTLTWSTEPVCVRVRGIFKAVYKRYIAPDKVKRGIFKESVEHLITQLSHINLYQEPRVTINFSPTINIENKVKVETNVTNVNVILAEVREIAEKLYRIASSDPLMPPVQRSLIERLYKKVSGRN